MRVLSLNTWDHNGPWQQRRETLIEEMLQYAPDVLILQEVFDAQWSRELQARLEFPFLTSTEPARSGLVILSRLPPSGSETYRMQIKSPLEDYWRYALWTKIGSQPNEFNIFNTHLSWKLEDQQTREAQVKELRAFMERSLGRFDHAATIIAGDFNCTADSKPMVWLMSHSDLVDAYRLLHPEAAGFTWDNRNAFAKRHVPPLPDRRIDYILARSPYAENFLRRCDVVFDNPGRFGIFPSDHFGLFAEFES